MTKSGLEEERNDKERTGGRGKCQSTDWRTREITKRGLEEEGNVNGKDRRKREMTTVRTGGRGKRQSTDRTKRGTKQGLEEEGNKARTGRRGNRQK